MTFPDDYPRSKAFHRNYASTENDEQSILDRYSEFKNNLQLSSATSFDKLAPVIINCPWGGTPESGDSLYKIKTDKKEKYETVKFIDVEDKCKVGMITSGLYSLIRGRGYGIGYIKVMPDDELINVKRGGRRNQYLVWLHRGQHLLPMLFHYISTKN